MKIKKSILLNCGLSLIIFLFATEAARVEAADIRGKITQMSAIPNARVAATVQIEGKIEKDTQFDKASVRILPGTRILKLQGGKPVKADVPDLKVGQTVEAAFAGPVAESYPVQAAAREILILAEADKPANPRPPATQAEAMAIQNLYTDRLMNMTGVVGVGLGQNARGQFTIHVMVKDAAAAKNPQIPKELEGMPVETEITGEIKAY